MASSAWPTSEDVDGTQESRDFCDYENYALPGAVLASFNELRHSNDLIDVVLVTENKEIPCHRIVLAAGSPYFKAMFTRNVEERRQQRVTIRDINPAMLQMLVDYLYTSQVRISTDNVQELLATANFFLVKCLEYACSNFLIRQLDVENCIEMHSFAETQGCEELGKAACRFAVRYFPDVSRTEGFLNASAHLLRQYISHDDLNIVSETELLGVLLAWLGQGRDREDKQRCFASLVQLVRLPFVRQEYLSEMSKLPAVMNVTGCKELFTLAADCREDRLASLPKEWKCPRRSTNYVEMLVVIGGVQNVPGGIPSRNRSNSYNYCCDPQSETRAWSKLAPIPYSLRNVVMYDVVRYKNDIYLTGGFDGEKHPGAVTSVWAYRTDSDTWEQRQGLNVARYQHCSAVLNGQIYVIGGYDGQSKLASVEVYDSKRNTWTSSPPLITPVAFATATVFDKRLFVIGGATESDCVFDRIQCYDLKKWTWSVISTLQIACKGRKSVLLNDLIYMFGGVSRDVQVYDPVCDKAFSVASMITSHMCTGATVLNGKIYVAGGDNLQNNVASNQWDSVECYDPALDRWNSAGTIPLSLYLHGVVTVIRNRLTLNTPPNEMLRPIGPSMLYRGYGEGRVNYDHR